MERNVAQIALFAALIAALGLLPKITIAGGVPITAQSLGIMLCGTILGSRKGTLAVLLFLVLVALGLPLLSGGRGGIGLFLSPSAGFLIGFPIAAFVIGLIVENTRNMKIFPSVFTATVIGGIVVLYIPGIIGMSVTLGKSLVEAGALALPFLPGDLIKAAAAALVTQALFAARPGMVASRN